MRKRTPRDSFRHCLENSAQQFFNLRDGKTELVDGYPWNEGSSRFAFMSLPGLVLGTGNEKLFKPIADNWLEHMDGPLIPGTRKEGQYLFDNVDAPLWFIWALQKYARATHSMHKVWKLYGKTIKTILNGYSEGTRHRIGMTESGLLRAGDLGSTLSWMDGQVAGIPVVSRYGYMVEVNALWYNAIRFALDACASHDKLFTESWQPIADRIPAAFTDLFWDSDLAYLADHVTPQGIKDWSVRPNQVIAASVPYSPLDERKRKSLLDTVRKELLTPRGLRTLSPKHPNYESSCFGSQSERDTAAYNGSAWPWLLGHFVEGYLRIHGAGGVSFVKMIFNDFEEEMRNYGLGSVAELYNGNPPHLSGGAISFAPSVAELLRIAALIDEYEQEDEA
jgi:predicted glycogen debranching enzyme